jgi:hypothetical protein
MRHFVTTVALIATVSLHSMAAGQGPTPSFRLRFMNAIPGMWKLDFRVETHGAFRNVTYGRIQPFRRVAEGEYMIEATTPRNQTTVIPPDSFAFSTGIDYTALATGSVSGDPAVELTIFEMPRVPIPRTDDQLLIINAVPDSGMYDFVIDGAVVSSIGFRDFDVPVIPQGIHTIELQEAGVTVAGPTRARMPGATTYTIVAIGTADETDGIPLQLKVFASK